MQIHTLAAAPRPRSLRALAAAAAALTCGFLWAAEPAASLDAARAAVDGSRFQEAKDLISAQGDAAETDAEALYLLGRAETALANFADAERALGKAIALDGQNAEYHASLGHAMIGRAQTLDMFSAAPLYMQALDLYRKAVALDNDNLGAHIALCRYYWNAPAIGGGSMVKAKQHAAEVARINPYLGKIERALIAQREGDGEAAAGYFAESLAMNPQNAWARFELAKLLQAAGKTDEAKAAFEAVLALDPQHAEAKAALESL